MGENAWHRPARKDRSLGQALDRSRDASIHVCRDDSNVERAHLVRKGPEF